MIEAFKRHWKIVADDDDDDNSSDNAPDPNQSPQKPDLSTMQTLVDGTAQALCLRIWKGYVSNNLADFPTFMQSLDNTVTQFVQSLPIPPVQSDLEDGYALDSWSDLPQIDPSSDDD